MAARITGGEGPRQQGPQQRRQQQQQQQQQHRTQQNQAAWSLTGVNWPPLIESTREIDERIGRTPTSAMVSNPDFPQCHKHPSSLQRPNNIYPKQYIITPTPPHRNPNGLFSSPPQRRPTTQPHTPPFAATRTKTPTSPPSTSTARATPTSSRPSPRTASPPTTSTCPRTTSP